MTDVLAACARDGREQPPPEGRPTRTRGVVFTPAELQYEGLQHVLGRVSEMGANAVAVTPGVFLPGDPRSGVREPPLDVEGHVRELDRPLWGSTVAYVRRFAPYEPDPEIWENSPFAPSTPAPVGHRTDISRAMIDEAHRLGLRPYVILSPTILPGLPGGHSMSGGTTIGDMPDRPLPVSGHRSDRIVAGQGCPNNPRVRDLVVARVREALKHYGDAAGFFFDWVEYTCYFPEDAFTCFCPACASSARAWGFDWAAIRGAVRALWRRLHELTAADLRRIAEAGTFTALLDSADQAAYREHQRFKSVSVGALFDLIGHTARVHGAGNVTVGASGFPPPWSSVTGADLGPLSARVDLVRPKFFTFHWSMMMRWYGQSLMEWNAGLDERLVVTALRAVFGMSSDAPAGPLEDFGMPAPAQRHPLTTSDIQQKVEAVVRAVGAPERCEAYIHSYQPVDDFDQLVARMEQTDVGGVWVQRYGYLSDEKLDRLRSRWREGPP